MPFAPVHSTVNASTVNASNLGSVQVPYSNNFLAVSGSQKSLLEASKKCYLLRQCFGSTSWFQMEGDRVDSGRLSRLFAITPCSNVACMQLAAHIEQFPVAAEVLWYPGPGPRRHVDSGSDRFPTA